MRAVPERAAPNRSLAVSTLAVAASLALAACTPATSTSSQPSAMTSESVAASPTMDVSHPVGLIAIGHSGLTGEGTAGDIEWLPIENSWATGSNPEVNSVYLRLVAAVPETDGQVANNAAGGAPAADLGSQAQAAFRTVPVPLLVIIQTIDNDIRCDGSDSENVPEFGQDIAEALDLITTASPNSHILMVGQLGRPSVSFIEELVAQDPAAKDGLTGTGICDFYDPAGELVEENFETLTAIIESYEAEQARVCAEFPQCSTDGGVRAAYRDTLGNLASDWAHYNIAGQAAQAELTWPVVKDVLGL